MSFTLFRFSEEIKSILVQLMIVMMIDTMRNIKLGYLQALLLAPYQL